MRTFSKVFLPIAAIAVAYFGSYFLMVHRGYGDVQCGYYGYLPAYRFDEACGGFWAERFSRVAHELDCKVLRPSTWQGRVDIVAEITRELENGKIK